MKLAILGSGISGAYLFRLLRETGQKVHIFDRNPGTRCGLTPCAWGTSPGFTDLVRTVGLDPAQYILTRHSYVIIDDLRIGADLMTIDKPALVRDLLAGAEIDRSDAKTDDYDRVIDATGVSRAFLPPIQNDVVIDCIQFRIEQNGSFENRIKLGKLGYAWSFPFSSGTGHVGCGSMMGDPRTMLNNLGWAEVYKDRIRCSCAGKIRISGPRFSQPFFTLRGDTEIWGVGEAIGCVAPLAGDGILTGMKSAQILMENWNDPALYTAAILKEFKWMDGERRVIDKIILHERFTPKDAWVLKKNSRRMAIDIGLRDAATLLKNLR